MNRLQSQAIGRRALDLASQAGIRGSRLSSSQFPLHSIAVGHGHGHALPLLRRRSQIVGKGRIVGIEGRLHGEVANLCLGPGLIVQADLLKVTDI